MRPWNEEYFFGLLPRFLLLPRMRVYPSGIRKAFTWEKRDNSLRIKVVSSICDPSLSSPTFLLPFSSFSSSTCATHHRGLFFIHFYSVCGLLKAQFWIMKDISWSRQIRKRMSFREWLECLKCNCTWQLITLKSALSLLLIKLSQLTNFYFHYSTSQLDHASFFLTSHSPLNFLLF